MCCFQPSSDFVDWLFKDGDPEREPLTNPASERGILFEPTGVSWTLGAQRAIERALQRPEEFMVRHVRGDWGEVCADTEGANNYVLHYRDGKMISAYRTLLDEKILVVTEAPQLTTLLLLPIEHY